ncbi:MAG: glycosyltransferase family 39 protein, partial [Desulfobacterales bacterium]|nr:glycosyltransferase family 39 protein [Desulfobacterales bacterium]
VPRKAILSFRAMRHVSLFLDKQLLYLSDTKNEKWKTVHQIDLSPFLESGAHELYLKVLNKNGPPALWAYSRDLAIHTDENWKASRFEKIWLPASSVKKIEPSGLSRRFKRADVALFENYPLFLTLFSLSVFLTCLFESRNRYPWFDYIKPTANRVRLFILLLWMILAINNIGKIPLDVGMDIDQHLEYIKYIDIFWRIPFPTEGVRMFESPLYYIISALIYKPLTILFSDDIVLKGLRIVPLLCGMVQIELCYRALKYVFPGKEDLQIIGTVVGGLLPINLYMSQVVGTEPLSGVFIGIVVVLMFRVIRYPKESKREIFVLIGFVWGLALLTKITAILLLPPLIFFILYVNLMGDQQSGKKLGIDAIHRVLSTIGIALLISGWYYIRNWLEIGKFFAGGWDASRGFLLLQDPGYRTLSQLIQFGESLFYPVYAGVMGFWDSLYSTFWLDGFLGGTATYDYIPPWNYDFMLTCVWLSILPAVAIILGLIDTVRRPSHALSRGTLFAASCIAVYFFAILYLFLTVPIYSTAKATYTMGIIPCYAVVCAAGMDMLRRSLFLKALTNGFLACWAFGAYFSYFVL